MRGMIGLLVGLLLLGSFLVSAGLSYTLQSDSHLAYPFEEIPKPRAPLLPRITSSQQLVPFAKIILQRDYIGQRLGWSIKGGERVLLIVNNRIHPWVVEALTTALFELKCPVEVIVQEQKLVRWRNGTPEWAEEALRLMEERLSKDLNTSPGKPYPSWVGSGTPRPRPPRLRLTEEQLTGYDVIIGPQSGPGNQPGLRSALNHIATPELLASPRVLFPGELMDLMERQKTWQVIRSAEKVRVRGVQGTDFTFTWFPEWWEIVEGTHPTIRSAATQSTFNTLRPGRSEYSVLPGHMLLHPQFGVIEASDAHGVVVSQQGDWDFMWPPLTIHLNRGEISQIEHGGFFGDFWRRSLELTQDVQYPGFSRPGTGWMEELALGTNPKVFGPMRVKELEGVAGRDPCKYQLVCCAGPLRSGARRLRGFGGQLVEHHLPDAGRALSSVPLFSRLRCDDPQWPYGQSDGQRPSDLPG